MPSVAVVGSSGGGAATLGHTDPQDLLRRIAGELRCVRRRRYEVGSSRSDADNSKNEGAPPPSADDTCATIRHALFLSLHGGAGLDSADPDSSTATLYAVGCGSDDGDDGDDGGADVADAAASAADADADADGNVAPPPRLRGRRPAPLRIRTVAAGPLRAVNETYRRLDTAYIAPSIASGDVDGLVLISSDPAGVNASSVSAAAEAGVPVTGSGGSSIGRAATVGARLVGNAGGSVATTSFTRAVSYVHALAEAWGCDYSPHFEGGGDADWTTVRPRIGSVLDSCVPAFVAVCVACRLLVGLASAWWDFVNTYTDGASGSEPEDDDNVFVPGMGDSAHRPRLVQFLHDHTGLEQLHQLTDALRYYALPTVTCVVTASAYAPEHGSTAIMAAGVASAGCGGSVLAGLLAGWSVAWLVGRTLFSCIRYNVPATMTNVIVAGVVGAAMALGMSLCGITAALTTLTVAIRSLVRMSFLPMEIGETAISSPPPGLGFLFGCFFCYGSKVGWYHSVFLPVILMEMERGEASAWGAVDECTLVLVSAGICAANVLAGRPSRENSPPTSTSSSGLTKSDYAISLRGLKVNLLCGDFIEAAYPFMDRSAVVNAFAYLASGASTEILYREVPDRVLGSAYLPVLLSVWLADDRGRAALACSVAFGVAFVGGLLGNAIKRRNSSEEENGRHGKDD